MRRKRVQQFLCDTIGIRVQESHPEKVVHLRELFEQLCQPLAQAQIFAVRSGVLPNQRDFPRARLRQIFRFPDH